MWGPEAAGGEPGRCVERSRKEALGKDTASTACASLHMCYFQLDGEQAKFSNRLNLVLKSSSPPPGTHCLQARGVQVCPGRLALTRAVCIPTEHTFSLHHRCPNPPQSTPQDPTLLREQRFQLLPFPLWAGSHTSTSILPNPSHPTTDLQHHLPSAPHAPEHSHLLSPCFFTEQKISFPPPLCKSPLLPPPLSPSL